MPERILACLPEDWGSGYPNVWIGLSVGSNKEKHRIKTLSEVLAKIRFASAEPLVAELNLSDYSDVLTNKFQ